MIIVTQTEPKKHITARCDSETYNRLEKFRKAGTPYEIKRSIIIENAVKEFLDRHENKEPFRKMSAMDREVIEQIIKESKPILLDEILQLVKDGKINFDPSKE